MTGTRNGTRRGVAALFNWRDWVWLALIATCSLMLTCNARAGAGALVLSDGSARIPAASVNTSVNMVIRGPVARVEVTQHFTNHTGRWMEGIYQFPMPGDAAVDGLEMRIGGRVIVGEVREREAARRVYEKARGQGRRAALVSQDRPNLFTSRVANIAPGETIETTLAYVQAVRWQDGAFELRFPLTYTPRFDPGQGTERSATPEPAAKDAANPAPAFAIDVRLDAGVPLASLESLHHAVSVSHDGGWKRLRLSRGIATADRDFVLRWEPATGPAPRVAAFSENVGDASYAMLMVVPPDPSRMLATPREVIFVLDTSGSMHGASIAQARTALARALEGLNPDDRFNVVAFDDDTRTLFTRPMPAVDAARSDALDWIAGQDADGGTVMAPALEAALSGEAPHPYLRQVVFMTDGAVGNDTSLLKLIHQRLGRARLFTVGIGAAPNSWFMRQAAEFGRGSFTHIGDLSEVDERMDGLFTRLAHPAMTDICVNWPRAAHQYPDPVPDLYAGEPLTVLAKLPRAEGGVEVCGTRDGIDWRGGTRLAGAARQAGIAKLWGRARIEALLDSRVTGADPDAVRRDVLAVALEHQLLSPFTSFVAVDRTPARTAERLEKRRLAAAAPAGASTGLPQTAAGLSLNAVLGLLGLLLALGAWVLRTPPAAEPA